MSQYFIMFRIYYVKTNYVEAELRVSTDKTIF